MNVVVGGGWSGIAAAVELASHDQPVTLIEAADRLGGRARSIDYHGRRLDNGQHLLIGAYHELLQLQRVLGLDEAALFERRPLELHMLSRSYPQLRLRLSRALPAPLHLVTGLLTLSGLGFADRLRALRLCAAVALSRSAPDCSVAALLARHRQSPRLVESLWQPLCLATLNTPIESASAAIFMRILRDAFLHRRRDADLLIPRCNLGDLLPEPARRFIEQHGGRVMTGARVTALEIGHDRDDVVTAIRLADGERIAVEQLILALPPEAMARLLDGHAATAPLVSRLQRFGSYPICTVWHEYPQDVALPFPMVGLHGTTAQWVFDHAITGNPGWMAVVISGPGAHMQLDASALGERTSCELAGFFPDWPAPRATHVVREKRATFISSVGIDAQRPGCESPFRNCRLAGDAVATGYPSTLEGAVRSGLLAARDMAVRSTP